jgi:hypothetical protein
MGSPTHVDNAIYDYLTTMGFSPLGFPIGAGRIFWVDGINGLDTNPGTTPALPFLTITHALTQCVNDRNDYIIVLDHWQEVVDINVTRVHIIGLSNYLRPNSNHSFVQMNAAADTAIFLISALSNNCEIAGFSFGGGATHAGIENAGGTPMGVHIHDCVFGHSFAGGTPQDGIRVDINATNIRIEHCVFLGAPGGKGLITRDGIHWSCGGNPLNGYIGENEFKALPGIGINFNQVADATGGITIKDNVFSCESDKQGAAIRLAATTRGFIVSGNKALYGPTTAAMANNPYLDLTTVAPFNAWMANYKGNVLIDPA